VSEADGIGLEFQVSPGHTLTHFSSLKFIRSSPFCEMLVQHGGSPASEQVPLDTGRPSVVLPAFFPPQGRQSSDWPRRNFRACRKWTRWSICGLRSQWRWGRHRRRRWWQRLAYEACWAWCVLATTRMRTRTYIDRRRTLKFPRVKANVSSCINFRRSVRPRCVRYVVVHLLQIGYPGTCTSASASSHLSSSPGDRTERLS
jgi:hypothetical protein